MQLRVIEKHRYRQRLNRITVSSIIALLLISLGSSTLLIALFATGTGSNFWLNFSGVVIGCLVVGFSLKRLKTHPYFHDVAYIWDLKHELNLIQRKQRAIDAAAEQNDVIALLILAYSYEASKLVWQLDDNTLMMSELNLAANKLQDKLNAAGLSINLADYRRELLARF
ncbi:DUF3087 family protein [Alishewanella sp. SMS8]|uniref:DUF3087 family protein n=1 Tax=Alishewanella sp. SMS8 TaxID=2994676 RepID=UPI002741885F|nr:DUF3087 family protein [Alishewanella sp. SMS8]MDP5035436.1 DUF3087 domain-containing protein [Alishewanella sp.]MDP5186749.1 DUF3087 domain-containing protein [Alishewanella sp.]MDP5460260.1 DUF3087 family protein [Alishewanella sp. SMS8]